MDYNLSIIVRILIATIFAVVLGNGSVVAFNHFPLKWFEDWREGESQSGSGDAKPDNDGQSSKGGHDNRVRVLPNKLMEADNAGRQRLASTPWKFIFTAYLGICGVYFAFTTGMQFEIASMLVLAIVLEMAIADQLYRIVPDQLQLMLAVSALGFVSYNENWWEPLAGAAVGLAVGFAVYALGAILYKTDAIGGADMKFYIGIGLVVGRIGVLIIFVITTLVFALQNAVKIARRQSSLMDSCPMMPAALVATTIYFLFLWNTSGIIKLF